MAFLDATVWLDWQDTNAQNEKRFSEQGIVNLTKNSTAFTDYISPSARDRFATFSDPRQIKIPVIVDQEVTVVTTPGFEFIPDNLTESQEYSFTVFDFFSGFRHYPAKYENNTLDAEFDRNVKMTNVSNALADKMEEILLTQLEARKSQLLDFTTQVNQSSGGGTYTFNGGTQTLEIDKAAQQETMFVNLNELMRANKLQGSYSVVNSPAGLAVQKQEAVKFGVANTKNIRDLGMIPAEDMHQSHNISAGSDVFNGFWVRDGAIGMFPNFPWDFRNGTTTGGGEQWSISPVELPFTRTKANIYTNKFSANATNLVSGSPSDSNLIMTAGEEMAIWIRIYVVYRFNSDLATRAQDIVKIKGLTT
jgi:hypothetical protein